MAKKKFESIPYDPIEAEHRRSVARAASRAIYTADSEDRDADEPLAPELPIIVRDRDVTPIRRVEVFQPSHTAKIEGLSQTQAPQLRPDREIKREKKRSFSCASREQDRELDMFLKRLSETADTVVPFQVMLRAACVCMMRAEEQIIAEMRRTPPRERPATFERDEYAVFEEYWTDVLGAALRKVRPHQGST